MKSFCLFIIFLGSISNILAQNGDIANVLNRLNSNKITYIYPGELELGEKTIILDAGESGEYKVKCMFGITPKAFQIKTVYFGISLSLWDYIFKTNYVPQDGGDNELGFIDDHEIPDDFLAPELYPLKL